MSSTPTVPTPNADLQKTAIHTWEDYQRVYAYSLANPDPFWGEVAREHILWRKEWAQVSACDYQTGKVAWYLQGELNVAENCLDRHLAAGRGEQRALIWVGNEVGEERVFTYHQLHAEVCKAAHALEASGIKKGDRVVFYLPNVPELAIGVLACARVGAVHSVIFGGFSAHSIQSRVVDCGAKMMITANGTYRGDKWVPLKDNVDEAMRLGCPSVQTVVALQHDRKRELKLGVGEIGWDEWLAQAEGLGAHRAVAHSAQDPLFILYTSGSTGKPKGVLHTMGGYLTYVTYTFKTVFQPKEANPGRKKESDKNSFQDSTVYWCTADMGWITGHSYLLYGPLSSGVTTVMYEGIPTYPDASRFWEVVDRYQIGILYTAPTAIRILAAAGENFVKKYSRKSLRILGTVGEPINPEAWRWYQETVGEGRCPIVDTWWQTETGGILISPLAGISQTKPGSASFPLPGIKPLLLSEEGKPLPLAVAGASGMQKAQGALVLAQSWPGQMVGVYGEPERFYKTYFTQYPGYYFSGDAAECDEDGFFWIKGRTDDVIKVSGHRLGTAEIESACILHPSVTESAAVGVSDPVTGEALHVFVVLKAGLVQSESLRNDLAQLIRKEVGPVASPKKIIFIPALPKTRSGKIMRRVLKKIALKEVDQLGDLSTLADPGVVDLIIKSLEK